MWPIRDGDGIEVELGKPIISRDGYSKHIKNIIIQIDNKK